MYFVFDLQSVFRLTTSTITSPNFKIPFTHYKPEYPQNNTVRLVELILPSHFKEKAYVLSEVNQITQIHKV